MSDGVELLRKEIAASGIKHVAIVDDAFDTPLPDAGDAGGLLDFLQLRGEVRVSAGIDSRIWNDAIADISASEHDSENVAEVVEKLYEKYIDSGDVQYDPAGLFKRTRDANLGYLRPILKLLTCDDLTLYRFGSNTPELSGGEAPDLVLVDLFLSAEIAPTDSPEGANANVAAQKSLDRARPLLVKDPAVILMSSHGDKGQAEAENYRAKLEHKVYASRFGFVDKAHVKLQEHALVVDEAARDTLLDIFQTYKFGKALTEAISRWLDGASKSVDAIGKDIRNLQLKELAYLVQFRLATEGQGLEEYLEWFFGEALLDYIVRNVDEAHAEKAIEAELEQSAISNIGGGYEPTQAIAKMYHRVRVENARGRPRKNFRLGDLYRENNSDRVIAVMSPDCDLVLRKTKKGEERNADNLLVVPGRISDLEKVSGSVGDFLMIGETPHNIQWLYKKVFSLPFKGTFEKAGQSGLDYKYLGALRPLYAQEIQAHLLNHVGRVGVAVPPIIGLPAIATIVVRTPHGTSDISISGTELNCNLVPGRASGQNSRVIFDRHVIRQIVKALTGMPVEGLIPEAAENVPALNSKAIEEALKGGPDIGVELHGGIKLATGKRDGSKTGPWCAIYVSQVTIPKSPEKEPEAPVLGVAPPVIDAAPALAVPEVGLVDREAAVTGSVSDISL